MVKKKVVRRPRVASKRRAGASPRRKYGVIIRPMPEDDFYTIILKKPISFIPRLEQP